MHGNENMKFDMIHYRAAMTTGIYQCVIEAHYGRFRHPPLYENVMAGCFENEAEMLESCGLSRPSPVHLQPPTESGLLAFARRWVAPTRSV